MRIVSSSTSAGDDEHVVEHIDQSGTTARTPGEVIRHATLRQSDMTRASAVEGRGRDAKLVRTSAV
ncbi:MAG: hypothetical protein A3F70_17945 [Acidobacteria bacterium RIFCSPLOWO2_12_FULL_67_14]|nr:MAG: hypothetical protein A3F70_17945 [Acidobacteria bacterium RIFCSPLOWO2_12_FULL_67_14]